jgi:hypothetical protein
MNAAKESSRAQLNVKRVRELPYSTLPIFFTAAIRRVLSSVTNVENSGASRRSQGASDAPPQPRLLRSPHERSDIRGLGTRISLMRATTDWSR